MKHCCRRHMNSHFRAVFSFLSVSFHMIEWIRATLHEISSIKTEYSTFSSKMQIIFINLRIQWHFAIHKTVIFLNSTICYVYAFFSTYWIKSFACSLHKMIAMIRSIFRITSYQKISVIQVERNITEDNG